MKKLFITPFILFILMMASHNSKAATYYVISGEPFTLAPATGSTSFLSYIWTIDPGVGQVLDTLNQASGGALTYVFGDSTAKTPTRHRVTLGVLQSLQGCLSELVEHTIIVLPKVEVTISASQESFCLNTPVNSTLTAKVTVTTGLDQFDVSLSPLAWTKDNTPLNGQVSDVLTVNAPGTYRALVSYVLPKTGEFVPTASKLVNSVIPGVKEILNNLPVPSVPAITLN